jgi:membrane associated rhomboid family serine protease
MLLPVGDAAPRKGFPFVNYLLIATNIAVFFWVFMREDPREVEQLISTWALVPNAMRWETLVTTMFLHGGIGHLFGNMLFLWIAGDNVEDRLGHLPYLVFYFAAGIAGSLLHAATASGTLASMPTVGASGAISGVMGAYLVFFPGNRIKFVLVLFVAFPTFLMRAWQAIFLWVGAQLLMARHQMDGVQAGEQVTVAVFAHLGGFAFGFLAALLLRLYTPFRRNKEAA